MTGVPPHSVADPPGFLAQDRYAERNGFLHLLLGMISMSERVLQVAPTLAVGPVAKGRPPAIPAENDNREASLQR